METGGRMPRSSGALAMRAMETRTLGKSMVTFAICTHVGDDKRVQVNLDNVETIEPYQSGALIKFSRGANSALQIRETPEEVAHAANPKNERQGPLRINLATGKWVDMETGKGGGDAVSLAAHLQALPQFDAARRIAAMLGLSMTEATAKEPRPTSNAA